VPFRLNEHYRVCLGDIQRVDSVIASSVGHSGSRGGWLHPGDEVDGLSGKRSRLEHSVAMTFGSISDIGQIDQVSKARLKGIGNMANTQGSHEPRRYTSQSDASMLRPRADRAGPALAQPHTPL
jgi:hypothetical protein